MYFATECECSTKPLIFCYCIKIEMVYSVDFSVISLSFCFESLGYS